MRPRFLIFCCFFLMIISCKKAAKEKETSPRQRPNIVFIMADDHAYQAISAYSDKLIHTPNIDRLAKEGMRFTNATVTNSICAPSRAVILTGKHSHLNGKIDNLSPFDTTNVTFPQLLQRAGYQTAMFGKLHFGNNPKGFDEFKILPGQGAYYNPDFITNTGDTTITGHVTDITTDLTLDWMKKRRDPKKPFLLMYLHKAPHRNWMPAAAHYKTFTKKQFPVPSNLFDTHQAQGTAAQTAEMGILKHMQLSYDLKVPDSIAAKLTISNWNHLGNRTKRLNPTQKASWDSVYTPIAQAFAKAFPKMNDSTLTLWKYQRYMQDYLGTIAGVDENVGRLLNYLDAEGLTENTLVVYTSDQGFYLGEHGWFDKRMMYNESFKTPLLVRWPNQIQAGITEDEMVQNLDFAQTFLELAQTAAPAEMQGKSLVPLFKGKKAAWDREYVYYHYYEYPGEHAVKRHYGIANKQYKLIHFYFDVDQWELYDLAKDPKEMKNVAQDPNYASILTKMKADLKEVRKKYKDANTLDQHYIQQYKDAKRIK